jgi:4,5-DOPA dioxygenase extradiol
MNQIAPVFVSHGAPTLALRDAPARQFLKGLGPAIGRPRAIVAVTAHWETPRVAVGGAARPRTIYDFGRFDNALFDIRYDAPGDPALAEQITDLLCAAGIASGVDPMRGLDHGVWVPLRLMFPDADIPVVPVSVQSGHGPAHHLQVGRALVPLTREGVLVLGSGSFTHDLARFRGQSQDAAVPDDVRDFANWFDAALTEGRPCDTLSYRALAPHAVEQHPTEEHLLPLFVALGAAGPGLRAERLHSSATFGVLRMDAYRFVPAAMQEASDPAVSLATDCGGGMRI